MKFFAPTILLALAGQALAAVDAYMSITDETGKSILLETSQTSLFAQTKVFEVSAWSYDVAQSLSITSQSSGAGAGKIGFNPLTIDKKFDGNTAVFFQNMAAGRSITATLYLFRSSGANSQPQLYLTISFRNAAFKTQSISSSEGGPLETIAMEYGTLQINYSIQSPSGTLVAQTPVGWNRVKNVAETTSVAAPK